MRTKKMARSVHAYVRGNTAHFYEWLADTPGAKCVPTGPAIWICGDCHLGNLGALSNGEGNVEVQIRDLDQAVIGNPAHDLIRLGLSLATAARGSVLPGVTTARMIEEMVAGYSNAIADPLTGEQGEEPDAIRAVRRKSVRRRWKHLAEDRLNKKKPIITLGKKFWALEEQESKALQAVFSDNNVVRQILSLEGKDADHEIQLLDAAYWMKGCSSLGLRRFAVLIEIDGKHRTDYALIDMKQAVDPIAPLAKGAKLPKDNAARVVTAAKALSPHLGERIIPVRMLNESLFIRELSPQDLKLEIDQFCKVQAVRVSRYLAFVVGKAHARQMDKATRRDWGQHLDADRRSNINAPTWLWQSVVALAGQHESEYLRHCRRYALSNLTDK